MIVASRRWTDLFGLALCLVAGAAQAALFARPGADLQQEAAAARAEGRKLAVVLTLPDCAGCREMERTVFTDGPTEKAVSRRFRTVHLDLSGSGPIVDAQGAATTPQDLAWRVRAMATPSIVFFDGDGAFLFRHTGTLDRAGLRALADHVDQARYEHKPFVPPAKTREVKTALNASLPAATLPQRPDFTLAATDGRVHRPADFRGRVIALAVGYTQCPDICPTTLVEMKTAVEGLPAGQRQDVQLLFASLDPERDSLAILGEYAAAFSPRGGRPVLGLRGDAGATAALIRQLQLVAEKQPSASMGYTLDHTAAVFLFDAGGRLRGVAPYGQGAAALRDDLAALLTEIPGARHLAQGH